MHLPMKSPTYEIDQFEIAPSWLAHGESASPLFEFCLSTGNPTANFYDLTRYLIVDVITGSNHYFEFRRLEDH